MTDYNSDRNILFITKATPEDDDFTLWLAPRLEEAGYEVFADILKLQGGERWRQTLTNTLHDRTIKQLLICTTEGLKKEGVQEEISIGQQVARQLGDNKFLIPLRLQPFRSIFGISDLQYVDFHNNYVDGLSKLIETLQKEQIPKYKHPTVQPDWEQIRRQNEVKVLNSEETLSSNWLSIKEAPDEIFFLTPVHACDMTLLRREAKNCKFPVFVHLHGLVTFASCSEVELQFRSIKKWRTESTTKLARFISEGWSTFRIDSKKSKEIITSLIRQAWEINLSRLGYTEYWWGIERGFHVSDKHIGTKQFVNWGSRDRTRRSMLRNETKNKVWTYGVTVNVVFSPFLHYRVKSRVLFSNYIEGVWGDSIKQETVIQDKLEQHRLRRRVCSNWRNRRWYGLLMAFLSLLSGNNSTIKIPLGNDNFLVSDARPIQVTSPVSTNKLPNQVACNDFD